MLEGIKEFLVMPETRRMALLGGCVALGFATIYGVQELTRYVIKTLEARYSKE